MTVSTSDSRVQFLGDGSTTVFSFGFKVLAEGDLTVLLTNTTNSALDGIAANQTATAVLNSDYTVSLSDPGGSVDFSPSSAPSTGIVVTIVRNTSLLQETDYVENDPFPADTHERALDRAALRDQEIVTDVSRSLKYQIGDDLMVSTELPLKEERAGLVLGFNAQGTPIAVSDLPDTATVSAFAETLLDDANASEARSTLGVTGLADLFAVTGGTGSAYTATVGTLSEEDGRTVFLELHANSADDATLNFNSNGAKNLEVIDKINGGADNRRNVVASELRDGGVYAVLYRAASDTWVVLSGTSVGGSTAATLPDRTVANTFTKLQTVSTAVEDNNNGFKIGGTFAGAHDFRIVQRNAGIIAVRDETLNINLFGYNSNTDNVFIDRDLNVTSGNMTLGGLTINPRWRLVSTSTVPSAGTFDVTIPASDIYAIRISIIGWAKDAFSYPFVRFIEQGGSELSAADDYVEELFGTGGSPAATSNVSTDRINMSNRFNFSEIGGPGFPLEGEITVRQNFSNNNYTRISGYVATSDNSNGRSAQHWFTGLINPAKYGTPKIIDTLRFYSGTGASWVSGGQINVEVVDS